MENKNIKLVFTKKINNENELKNYHKQFLSENYEGSIIRWGDAGYKIDGRSENLLKFKDFQDLDAEIIDVEPAEQRPEWGVPVLKYKGKIFRAGMKFSHSEREEFLKEKHKYIGMKANIRFFEYTDEGMPRFPVCVGVHFDR